MKTSNHKSRTRERMSAPTEPIGRRKRRAEARKEQRALRKLAIRERMKANPRLVRA